MSSSSRANLRPLVVDDREIDVVAVSAVRINHVLAEDALLHGSKPQDRGARFLVIDVRLEFDSPALQHVERVPQLQQLGFSINVGALERGSDPGYADFSDEANAIKMQALGLLHEEAMKSFARGSKAAADFIDAYSKRMSKG